MITAFVLPQTAQNAVRIQQATGISFTKNKNAKAIAAYRLQTTPTRFKRRPVGLNDYHDRQCAVICITLRERFVYVADVISGYHSNPYLSIPVPLRSWRGPPTV
ncbi:MAG TPA: hypothetical protein VM802_27015 [Chitinophaga sp.]|uniref:hypothetical protein n=1 Tax=Chitinophaga sp. TaxID=1869181 RepID=UPI002CD9A4DB|nr:hypothetical protein [Chitinophaga sp.]HVI48549.1 hypothetical protein [Chitinophaga sp.]